MKQKGKKSGKKLFVMLVVAAVLLTGVPQTSAYAQNINQVKPIVIVLDPGHGGGDSGATHRWNGKLYREKDANLAIAKACKKKLESYTGVRVYLTRSSDYFVTLEGRVAFAKKNGADLFVALHNNASLSSKTKGACVYYPNSHYNSKIGTKGNLVAQRIQSRLAALGLKNNGVFYRNSENRSRYPDKSLADYYSVIRNSKNAGFAGLIVEHAYISNASDCTKYLGSDKMLTKLGEADALGIASYYGLIPKTTVALTDAEITDDGEVQLAWTQAANVDGYCVYRREKGVTAFQRVKKISGDKITQYTDNTLIKGVTYEYGVCGYCAGKNATTYTVLSNTMTVSQPFAGPENLRAEQSSAGTWMLRWDAAKNVSGYRVERRIAGEDDFVQIAEIKAADQTVYEPAENGVTGSVEYRVSSFYKDKKHNVSSEYSEIVTVELP